MKFLRKRDWRHFSPFLYQCLSAVSAVLDRVTNSSFWLPHREKSFFVSLTLRLLAKPVNQRWFPKYMQKVQNVGTGKQLPHQMEENVSTLQGDSDGQYKYTYFFKEPVHFGRGFALVNFDPYFLKFTFDLYPQIRA